MKRPDLEYIARETDDSLAREAARYALFLEVRAKELEDTVNIARAVRAADRGYVKAEGEKGFTDRHYRLFVNAERTVLLTVWDEDKGGAVTVATRETSEHTWGPPVYLEEEK